MGIKRKYKNVVEKFLSNDQGKRFFQFFYSWGAAIVIIGALAKLMHWSFGNGLLMVGLLTEFGVFFISAFDRPPKEYKWEDVFPVLNSRDPDDRPMFGGNGNGNGNGGYAATGGVPLAGGAIEEKEMPLTPGQIKKSFGIPSNVDISEEDTNALTASIKKLSGAAEQLVKMAEMTDATQQYLDQLSQVSGNMQKFNDVTNNLTDVSDVLLNSYKSITNNSDGLAENSKGYMQQMEALNRNITSLNNIYEIQLYSLSSQMESVNRINAGLSRIKEMYEGSVINSAVFRTETEKMTQHIAALNTVYSRLLNAMTMNMNMNMQPVYQNPNPGYTQPYSPNPNPNPGYAQPYNPNPNPNPNV
jgi:gliding motility-associated protein GldL